ncbi:MAG: hypothetical protein LBR38_08165 [Synergistaceae bacterium]|jgi:hypothetical protein|nr:hypothetical protein [Synergistaceae bacterium]
MARTVYIPFDDGSSVSYDGERFVLRGRPLDIDADLRAPRGGAAAQSWQTQRGDLVKALKSAWRRENARIMEKKHKMTYTDAGVVADAK